MYKRKINILLIGIIVSIVLVTTFQTVSAEVTSWSYYDVGAGQAFDPATYEVLFGNEVQVSATSTVATTGWKAQFTWKKPNLDVFIVSGISVGKTGLAESQIPLDQEGTWIVDVEFTKPQQPTDTGTSAGIDVGPDPSPEFPYGIAIVIFSSSLTYLMMRKGRKTR